MSISDYRNRSAEQIITENIFHDAEGMAYRAASWLDLAARSGHFASFHYACIDGRLAIEYLFFQQLVIVRGGSLSEHEYQSCLSNKTKLEKLFVKFVPDYEKLLDFTDIVSDLTPEFPKINKWNLRELKNSWGVLSSYLHWSGPFDITTENDDWQKQAIAKVGEIIYPIWEKMTSGRSGCMAPGDMKPAVREIWEDFKTEKIGTESVRIRLELIRPMLRN